MGKSVIGYWVAGDLTVAGARRCRGRWTGTGFVSGSKVMTDTPEPRDPDGNLAPLVEAVHSIYGFIVRTAQPEATGTAWTTIGYDNQPHRSITVFNGAGGIPFFLTDYHRRFEVPAALTLGQSALDWCERFSGKHHVRGLHFGQTGPAYAALHRANALGEPVPAFTLANARAILAHPPGPVTDLIGGEASNGFFLLKLWARTQDAAHLAGAVRCAVWLEAQMQRDEHGTHCIINPDGTMDFRRDVLLGVAHGISGVAHFLVLLAEATRDERWANLARELFATVTRQAVPVHGGLNWPPHIGYKELVRCQWSHGAAGIGLTYLAAHRVFGDRDYLDLAVQAAEATWGYGDFRSNYTQCTGLAGGGELLLETHLATGDGKWQARARDFAHQCLRYRESTPEGDSWPTDGPGLPSADFDYGAAGVGHFLLRVTSDQPPSMPLM